MKKENNNKPAIKEDPIIRYVPLEYESMVPVTLDVWGAVNSFWYEVKLHLEAIEKGEENIERARYDLDLTVATLKEIIGYNGHFRRLN